MKHLLPILLLLFVTVPEGAARCVCYACKGRRHVEGRTACLGRSRGCTMNDPNAGCYGQEQGGSWHTGFCTCASGQFSEPDQFWLHGTVSGLAPHSTLVVSASSPVALHELEMRDGEKLHTQTSHVGWNGKFSFPYKLARGQLYIVSVRAPSNGQRCSVAHGASGMAYHNIEKVRIVCRALGRTRSGAMAPPLPPPPPQQQTRHSHMHPHVAAAKPAGAAAAVCADSAALHAGDTDIVETSDTTLPCARRFHSSGGQDWMTSFMGHRCIGYTVTASAPVTVCLVPDVAWFSSGRRAVMAKTGKGAFCACRGKTTCAGELAHADIDSSYLLYVTPTRGGAPFDLNVQASACPMGMPRNKKILLGSAAAAALLGLVGLVVSKQKAPGNKGYSRIQRRGRL